MHEQPAITTAEIEKSLVDAIRLAPNARPPLLDLARFLENCGLHDESAQVYRGNLPAALQDRHQLDPYPRAPSTAMDSCTRLGWHGPEIYSLTPPANEDPKRNSAFLEPKVTTKPEFVDIMEDCTLLYDGKNRLYIDADGVRNVNHSTMNSYLLTQRSQCHTQATSLKGLSILLAAHNSHNFYHWHFDRMTALGSAQAAGVNLADIDHVLIDSRCTAFQLKMLECVGITKDKIRLIDVTNCHVRCEKMLMVRVNNSQGMAQSHRHLNWSRQTFLPQASTIGRPIPATQPKRLAIVRDVRGFTDAKEIYAKLEKNGYTCIKLEDFPYLEQVSLFANASHIVSPHGAGLSLLVYCKPGTTVHEFYSDHVQPCFWTISSAQGLNYHNYNCSDITDKAQTSSNKNLAERLSKTIDISAEKLAQVIQ